MASGSKARVEQEIRTLFEAGTVVGRSDGELLARFLAADGSARELAFAALVERHGPMVWRVCRDVLRESNEADDAFQATFLILARRAGGIRKRSSLGPWLYGVALRVARCARRKAGRRRNREQVAALPEQEEVVSDVDRLDAAPILHEEVGRLPEKYRSPLILCYFEGLTHDQAASQLGWPVGTVRSRLAEARDRLRPRLLRRGVAPSVAILAATGRVEGSAIVPAALVSATVGMAVGAGAAGTVPAVVAALVGTTLREMTLMKLSMIAIGLVATALVGTAGVGLIAAQPQNGEKAVTSKPSDPAVKASTGGSNPAGTESGYDWRSPLGSNFRSTFNSPRVLSAKIIAATENLRRLMVANQAGQVEFGRVAAARSEVEVLTAELDSYVDDFSDEVDLLQVQLDIRKADVQAAEAQLAKVIESHRAVEKMGQDKVVSQTEVRNSQRDVEIRSSEAIKKKAELNEVVLRIKQATRRRDEAIELAKRAKKLVPELEAAPQPAPPAAKP